MFGAFAAIIEFAKLVGHIGHGVELTHKGGEAITQWSEKRREREDELARSLAMANDPNNQMSEWMYGPDRNFIMERPRPRPTRPI